MEKKHHMIQTPVPSLSLIPDGERGDGESSTRARGEGEDIAAEGQVKACENAHRDSSPREPSFDFARQGALEIPSSPSGNAEVKDSQELVAPFDAREPESFQELSVHPVSDNYEPREYAFQLRPGAFRVCPGGPPDGSSIHPSVLDSEGSSVRPPSHLDTRAYHGDPREIAEIYVPEASLVLTAPIRTRPAPMLVTAQPLHRKRLWIGFGIGALFVMAVATGIAFAVNRRASTSAEPTRGPGAAPTPAPSALSSCSFLPISAAASDFRDTLPGYTVAAVKNCSSPQAKAFSWVTKGDDLPPWRMTQRFALAAVGLSTGVDTKGKWENSSGWLNSTVHECDWLGCSCANATVITALALDYKLHGGSIPREVGLLSMLTSLVLTDNELTGSIPSEISLLTNLSKLELYSNVLTRRLPTELGLLKKLTHMDVSANYLITGPVPTELGHLHVLSELWLGGMGLSSSIPVEFGNISSLEKLAMDGAGVSGEIPSSFGLLSSLTDLDLSGNKLSSTLPTQFGSLTALERLVLSNNELVGTMPSSLFALPFLTDLEIYGNSISGTIPPEIRKLSQLSVLFLEYNRMTGTIPTELGSLVYLVSLRLSANKLSGSIPTELGRLTNLEGLDVSFDNNTLTGTIPTEFGRLSRIDHMDLRHNLLGGSVPSEVCTLIGNGLQLYIDCNEVGCSCDCLCNDTRL